MGTALLDTGSMTTSAAPAASPQPTTNRTRVAVGVALTALSALMLVVMWPMFGGLWWLAPVAFVPMYVAQYRLLPRKWSFAPVAVACGAYGFAVGMLGASIAPMALILGGALGVALLGAVIGVFQRPFSERTRYRWFVLQLPIVWLFIEVAIQDNEILGSTPWLAYRMGEVPQLVAPVSVTGTPALSFLVLVVNAAIALVLFRWLDASGRSENAVPVPRSVARGWAVGVLAVAVVWAAAGVGITAQVRDTQGPAVRAAYVQPGLANVMPGVLVGGDDNDPRTAEQRRDDQAAHLRDLTLAAAEQGAQLVVWPEEVLEYDPREERTQWIPDLVRQTGIYLVAGFTRDFSDASQPNRALMWAPSGDIIGIYSKNKRVIMEGESFTPGTEFPVLATALGPLGMVICFDLDFPNGPVRQVTDAGARIVAAPSIDFASVADLRTTSTVFRAIENRVGIVKADLAWDSAVVGPDGQVLAGTVITDDDGGVAVAVVDLPTGPGGAPFTSYGNMPVTVLSVALLIALVVAMVVAARRERRNGGGVHSARIREARPGQN